MNKNLLKYLIQGLYQGYNQNIVLRTDMLEENSKIIEYLLTVNVAQKLIEWNESEGWQYSINLEYDSKQFFKNAFLPYMHKGDGLFDLTLVHPSIPNHSREGRIDIGVCREVRNFYDHLESVYGIELKGINPNYDSVISDVKRLVESLEMKDDNFDNSIQSGFSLFVRNLGGQKTLSSKESLLKSKKRVLNELKTKIKSEITLNTTDFKIYSKDFSLRSTEDFADYDEEYLEELTTYEIGRDTKIVFGVIIEIFRK